MKEHITITNDARIGAMIKTGDCLAFQLMIDCWRVKHGLLPMYFTDEPEQEESEMTL